MRTAQNSRTCKHLKSEEQYICLYEQCLKDQELKLDCLKCLQQNHITHENIEHVEDVLLEAQESQKTFSQLIDENLKFCEDLKSQLEQSQEDMKQKFIQWVNRQTKTSLDQIEKYEVILNGHKEKITTTQLTKDQLKNIIDFKLYDSEFYQLQNNEIQKTLKSNQKRFNEYFNVQFERLDSNYKCEAISQEVLPTVKQTFSKPQLIKFEKCQASGCDDDDKTKFCREKTCLLNKNLSLECPTCQTMKHCAEKKESHKQYFISANDLWNLQNKLIDELEQFCEKKEEEIEKECQSLQSMIVECQKINEIKLQQFRTFVVDKEMEIKEALKKFKQQYQKEEFVIYRELLLKTDFSVIADIIVIEENFKNISISFKEQFSKEKEITQEQFQNLWLKGKCQLQQDNMQKLKEFSNPVSKCIQELNDQIISLTLMQEQNIQTIQQLKQIPKNEQLKLEENISAMLKKHSEQLEAIIISQKSTEKSLNDTQQQMSVLTEKKEIEKLNNQIKDLFKNQEKQYEETINKVLNGVKNDQTYLYEYQANEFRNIGQKLAHLQTSIDEFYFFNTSSSKQQSQQPPQSNKTKQKCQLN